MSLTEREAVVKVQLQAAIDLLGEKDSKVKQDIQAFLQKFNRGYPATPTDKDKQEAQEACDLANLVRAIYVAKEVEIVVFQRPNLFNVIQEKSEIFSQRVQEVVNATNKPIIVGKELYQPHKDKVLLGNFNGRMCDITNSEHITILKNKAGQLKPVFCLNGATHQMSPGRMEYWAPSVGKNFKTSEAKPKLPLEEAVRKKQQQELYQVGESVAVSYSIGGGQSIAIGKVSIVDRSTQILEAKIDKFCKDHDFGNNFDDAVKNGIFKVEGNKYIRFSNEKHGTSHGVEWTRLMRECSYTEQGKQFCNKLISMIVPAPATDLDSPPAPTCCCFDCQYLLEYIKNTVACCLGGDGGCGR